MKKRTITVAVGCSVASLLAIGAGQPAFADAGNGNWTLLKTQYLTDYPTPSMSTSCTAESVTLPAGEYYWYQGMGSADAGDRYIELKASAYIWMNCLTPGNGLYTEQSSLEPSSGETATLTDYTVSPEANGSVTWGSGLSLLTS